MARKKSAERELHWREILDRQAASGLSIGAFCREARISQPSFYAWRKKLRERENDGAQGRASMRRQEEPGTGPAFIPLKLRDSASSLEVIHPLGYRVRVSGEVNIRALRQVLDALDGRGNG